MAQRTKALTVLLRILALINFAAIVAVVAPKSWIAWCHELIGMGEFPAAPIAGYLARSTSLWFASFGVMLWFVSGDVVRYRSLIAFLGWAMMVQGVFMIGVDCAERMPIWWVTAEGPTCLLLGAAILRLVSAVPVEIEPPRSRE